MSSLSVSVAPGEVSIVPPFTGDVLHSCHKLWKRKLPIHSQELGVCQAALWDGLRTVALTSHVACEMR